jgi:uncharacterized delta-60 repeat protein
MPSILKMVLMSTAALSFPLAAADGDIDTTFGVLGKQRVAFDIGGSLDDFAQSVVVAPNGMIYLVGTVAIDPSQGFLDAPGVIGIARLNRNGTLDLSYNGTGRVVHQDDFGNGAGVGQNIQVNDAALQADGKLVVVGTVLTNTLTAMGQNYDMLVCRFLATGEVDGNFGDVSTPGCAAIEVNPGNDAPPSDSDSANALVLASDGKIMLAGSTKTSALPATAAIVRLNTDGSVDQGFGTGGFVFTSGTSDVSWTDIAIAPGGKLVTVSEFFFSASNSDFLVKRTNPDGTSDGAFPIGFDMGLLSDYDQPTAVSVLGDGSILVAGNVDFTMNEQHTNARGIVKLDPTGTVDTNFGTNGRTVVIQGMESYAEDMLVQSDGKIVVAGSFRMNANFDSYDFGILRLTSNGGLDTFFGGAGQAAVPFDYNNATPIDTATSVVSQGGQLIIAGFVVGPGDENNRDYAVTRLVNDLIFADDFEIAL